MLNLNSNYDMNPNINYVLHEIIQLATIKHIPEKTANSPNIMTQWKFCGRLRAL